MLLPLPPPSPQDTSVTEEEAPLVLSLPASKRLGVSGNSKVIAEAEEEEDEEEEGGAAWATTATTTTSPPPRSDITSPSVAVTPVPPSPPEKTVAFISSPTPDIETLRSLGRR